MSGRGRRIAVLDIGSNSAHVLVADAYPGAPPLPVFRYKAPTRIAEASTPMATCRRRACAG